jgi:antitoxin Phd
MASWEAHVVKARFSELLETALKQGPQIVTRRGVDAAVLVPIEQWNRLQNAAPPNLKSLLLEPNPRFDNVVLQRRSLGRRDAKLLR